MYKPYMVIPDVASVCMPDENVDEHIDDVFTSKYTSCNLQIRQC